MQQSRQKRGQVGLPDAAPEQIGRGRQPADLVGERVHQVGLRVGPTIGQDALEVVPDAFVRIEFRGVRWKGHQMQPARPRQEVVHRVAAMDGAVVQQDDHVPADLTEEMPQEHDHLVALDVVLVEVAVQGTMEPPGADGDAGDGGDPIVTLAMTHDGGLADGTPGLADRRD